jgi:hypothetical protein
LTASPSGMIRHDEQCLMPIAEWPAAPHDQWPSSECFDQADLQWL